MPKVLPLALCLVAFVSCIAQGQEAPAIFNGQDLSGWQATPDKMAAHWSVENGLLNGDNPDKKGSVLWTEREFSDYEFEIEFQTDSSDYDSGVFVRGQSHQVQIGVSRSLKLDLTGCIYAPKDKQGKYPAKTEKVAKVHKLGKWNRLRIRVVGKRIQTFLNDEPFVDYQGIALREKGKIGLQLHGGVHMKMQFRNIRIQELEKTGTASDTEPDAKKSSFEVTKPPAELEVDPFYKKYVSANGLPVLSSDKVNDYALKEAAFLVTEMLARRPDILKAMIKSGSRLCIIGHNEYTTDLPGWAHLKPKDYWDARARGMGGSRKDPLCSCAEENLLGFPGDPYSTESIFIHELAHNIHLRGVVNVDETFDARVKKAYDTAMAKELWSGKYASVNHHEYFAEGVQSWFDNNRAPDHDHNHVDTRRELVEYDAALADLCREVFGDTKLTYTKPATRLHGHMEGYDPSKAPAFKWPDRLKKAQAEIHRKATERSKRGQSPKKK